MHFLSDFEFRDLARAGTLPRDAAVRQTFTVATDPGEDRSLTFTVSTSDVDRLDSRILASGWDLRAYRQNPTVLWAHERRELPIGRAVRVWIESDRLRATVEFMPADLHPFADQIHKMLQGGWLRGISVGFRPLEWRWAPEEDRKGQIDFLRAELIELSITPTPANADALADPVPSGRDTGAIEAGLLAQLLELEALR